MKFFPRVLICLSRRVLKTTLSIWPTSLRLAGLVWWWEGTLKLHWKGNRSGGLKHIKLCPRGCKANANVSWILWEMCCKNSVKTYIERPKGSPDNAFYLKGIRTFRTQTIRTQSWDDSYPIMFAGFLLSLWVTTNSIPSWKLTMMAVYKAGIKGYFADHSLRATAVSRLSQEGVNEKLIRGVTEHRSEALQSYKRETNEQLQ